MIWFISYWYLTIVEAGDRGGGGERKEPSMKTQYAGTGLWVVCFFVHKIWQLNVVFLNPSVRCRTGACSVLRTSLHHDRPPSFGHDERRLFRMSGFLVPPPKCICPRQNPEIWLETRLQTTTWWTTSLRWWPLAYLCNQVNLWESAVMLTGKKHFF